MHEKTAIPAVIFVSSCASLAFEVALTRVFSITLSYHFAFMIVSIAMLGYAASGTFLTLHPAMREPSRIGDYTLLLGIAITGGYLLANLVPFDQARLPWEKSQLLYLLLYYLTLALPFFCCGLIIATAFSAGSERSGLLYGADLTGAGAGSLAILLLLWVVSPERAIFLVSATVLAVAFLAGGRRARALAIPLILLDLALFILQPGFAALRISPYKGLPTALRYPGATHLKRYLSPFDRIDAFRSPAVRFAPGLSLRYLEPLPEQIGLAIDGGETTAVTAVRDANLLAFLDYLPSALPYSVGRKGRVLVLDPKGGLQKLVASRSGAGRITGIESNADLVRVIRDDFGVFSGHIYAGNTWTGLGRSWLLARQERFDIIDVSLLGTEPAGLAGIGEEYRFTVEAFREYLAHLEKDGLLSVNLYIIPPPRTELRLLATVAAALTELGAKEPARHLALIRSWGSLCLVAKREPLTADEIAAVKRFASERWFDLVYYPGIRQGESGVYIKTAGGDYSAPFAAILDPGKREAFLEGYPFDIRPVRDDRPFFHYFLRMGKIGEIYRLMGKKWQFFLEEGYFLPALLLQVAGLGLLLVLLPLAAGRRGKGGEAAAPAAGMGKGLRLLPYFALLGLGFMFVEIVLIQRLILPLENPSYAVATVLSSLLVSSGAGSLLSYRFAGLRSSWLPLVIALLVTAYGSLLPSIPLAAASWPLAARVILVFLLLVPLGLPMGVPFPAGVELLGRLAPSLIPWAWAINGTLSVLAPLLAIMLAMVTGFSGVLLLGALAYLLAAVNLKAVDRDP